MGSKMLASGAAIGANKYDTSKYKIRRLSNEKRIQINNMQHMGTIRYSAGSNIYVLLVSYTLDIISV